jgi:hypothetical protein
MDIEPPSDYLYASGFSLSAITPFFTADVVNRISSLYCQLQLRSRSVAANEQLAAQKHDRHINITWYGVCSVGASALAQDPLHGFLSSLGTHLEPTAHNNTSTRAPLRAEKKG